MGTNFYAVTEPCSAPCPHCEQEDIHIGKSHVMFEAHSETPWGAIRSWQDWKRVFAAHPHIEIHDEYGQIHEIEQFIEDVESTPPARRRRQYDVVQQARYSWLGKDDDYLDDDGFSWTRGAFT